LLQMHKPWCLPKNYNENCSQLNKLEVSASSAPH
jgi:hypothetical protein